jgi:hypothetical protein
MNPKRNPKVSTKHLLLAEMHSQKNRAPLRVVTPSETEKLTFTLAGDTLHVRGPRHVLEKLARQLKRLGAKCATNPYET